MKKTNCLFELKKSKIFTSLCTAATNRLLLRVLQSPITVSR
jgi:hypothetical protein